MATTSIVPHAAPGKRGATAPRPAPQKKPGFSPRGRLASHATTGKNHDFNRAASNTVEERRFSAALSPKKETGLQPQWTSCLARHDREGHDFNRAACSTVEERRFSAASSPKKETGLQPPWTFWDMEAPRPRRARLRSCRNARTNLCHSESG